jgi:hypothetical protein
MSDPTPTQAEADALKLQGHGAAATDLPPAVVDIPSVSGAGTVGGTLTCTMGNWTGEPSGYAYEWRADTTNVLGNGESYVVDEVCVGHEVCCVVTASNAFGSTQAPPSNATMIAAAGAQSARAERAERSAPRERDK